MALDNQEKRMSNDKNINQDEWEGLLSSIKELSEWFPEGLVMIGGVAVYFYAVNQNTQFAEVSHDGDFYLSLLDYSDLRDIEEVTPNRRLGKSQIIKNGFDFDIYVERNNKLAIPYQEIVDHSVVINNIRCASLDHLLILKVDAYLDRKGSAKGDKDERDIVKIICSMNNPNIALIEKWLTPERENAIQNILNKSSVFNEIAYNNLHESKIIRQKFIETWHKIKNEIQDEPGPR